MVGMIYFVLVLGLLIFFHEMGHFLVAKALGIGVKTFSLGFGPPLLRMQRGSTEYRLSLLPLGGYVKLVGEVEQGEEEGLFSEEEHFSKRPPYQRMMVVAAGPIFNLLLAWIIYFFIFLCVGQQVLLPSIGQVVEGSPACKAGLRSGDRIVAIDGKRVQYWYQLVDMVGRSKGKVLEITVVRGRKTLTFHVKPRIVVAKNIFGEEVKVPRIGIIAADRWVHIRMGPFASIKASFKQTWVVTKLTVEGMIKLMERVIPLKTIGGPIMIAQMVSKQAQYGIWDVLGLTALISINLGLLNLLPIPVLDGGHILFYGLETIMRRPLSPAVREIATRIGLTLLIVLMLFAVYNDIVRIVTSK